MKDVIFYTYMACLLLSGVTAIVYSRFLGRWKLTIMTFYLPVLFIMEVYTAIRAATGKSNYLVYNIYRPVSVFVFAVIYYSIPIMSRFRKMIVGITLVYLVLLVVAYSFIVSIEESNTSLTLARGICITFPAVFYLISLLLLDTVKEQKFWQPLTWITIGVLVFYPVISISVGFQNYLYDNNATVLGFKLYQVIPQLMSIFMYGCFTYAFYLCKKTS